jgi:hypothetical protein
MSKEDSFIESRNHVNMYTNFDASWNKDKEKEHKADKRPQNRTAMNRTVYANAVNQRNKGKQKVNKMKITAIMLIVY